MNIKYFIKQIKKIIVISLSVLTIILVLFSSYIIYLFFESPDVYKNSRDYNKCIKSEYYQESIKHFPKAIPNNAYEAKLYCSPSRFENDRALILLKLKVDKDYIKNELINHKFLNTETQVGTVQRIYHMPSETVDIKRDKLTYYVLNEEYNYNEEEEYFPYFTGIGTDKNYEYILYYYIRPD